MDFQLDTYELKARIAPTVVVLFPLFLLLCVCGIPEGFDLKDNLLSGIIGIVALYLLAQLLAYYGRKLQRCLFEEWGGAPSTRIMRWGDTTMSVEQKTDIAQLIRNTLNQSLPSLEDESDNPSGADRKISQAFDQVRAYLYEKESKSLWRHHLAEYGFARNLMASWFVAGIISLVCAGILFYVWHDHKELSYLIVGIFCVLWAVIFSIGRFTFLNSFTKHLGDRYALSAWTAFLQSARMASGGKA